MEPSRVAVELRRIADKLERSRNPHKAIVARDLHRVLASIGGELSWKEVRGQFPGAREALPDEIMNHLEHVEAIVLDDDQLVLKTNRGEWYWEGDEWVKEGPGLVKGISPTQQSLKPAPKGRGYGPSVDQSDS